MRGDFNLDLRLLLPFEKPENDPFQDFQMENIAVELAGAACIAASVTCPMLPVEVFAERSTRRRS